MSSRRHPACGSNGRAPSECPRVPGGTSRMRQSRSDPRLRRGGNRWRLTEHQAPATSVRSSSVSTSSPVENDLNPVGFNRHDLRSEFAPARPVILSIRGTENPQIMASRPHAKPATRRATGEIDAERRLAPRLLYLNRFSDDPRVVGLTIVATAPSRGPVAGPWP